MSLKVENQHKKENNNYKIDNKLKVITIFQDKDYSYVYVIIKVSFF